MQDFDKYAIEHQTTTAHKKVIRMLQGSRWDRMINEDQHRQSNMLPIVQEINRNKLRWYDHLMKEEEESNRVV